MLKKYRKYIYALLIFYFVWLIGLPLGFRFIAVPVIEKTASVLNLNLELTSPRLVT